MKPSEVRKYLGKRITVYENTGQRFTGKISYFINEGFEDDPEDQEDQLIIIGNRVIYMHDIIKIEEL